ncbi:hypothetical protein Hanom_Chr17g01582431 [Helianthus anomalus]
MGIFYICYETPLKKQRVFFLQTTDIWSTSSATEVCRCGPQTAEVLPQQKQTAPYTFSKSTSKIRFLYFKNPPFFPIL